MYLRKFKKKIQNFFSGGSLFRVLSLVYHQKWKYSQFLNLEVGIAGLEKNILTFGGQSFEDLKEVRVWGLTLFPGKCICTYTQCVHVCSLEGVHGLRVKNSQANCSLEIPAGTDFP